MIWVTCFCTAINIFLVVNMIWFTQTTYASKWWDIHENFIDTITTSIFHLELKENNENDMAAHWICFDFYDQPKSIQIEQKGLEAAADAPLASRILFWPKKYIWMPRLAICLILTNNSKSTRFIWVFRVLDFRLILT